jgi:hypothetical protein
VKQQPNENSDTSDGRMNEGIHNHR